MRDSPETPRALFKDLFTAVQDAKGLFPDSKSFADAVPKRSPAEILALYHHAKPATPQALKSFVEENFTVPVVASAPPSPAERVSITRHIDSLWDNRPYALRPSDPPRYSSLLSTTPEPYVVPGGRFGEMYYWDSYFTMLGLKRRSKRRDLVEHMVADFAYLIDKYGHIPNGTRTYYISRSQPPFFYAMVGLLGDDASAADAKYLGELRREYAFWMDGEKGLKPGAAHRRVVAMPDGAVLNRYWDDSDTPRDESYLEDTDLARRSGRVPKQVYRDLRAAAESGWDFSTRWFADGKRMETIETTAIVPVDLNSLLFGLEEAIRARAVRAAG